MRVMTILGTRPEIIRLSEVIRRLDALCDHLLVHTGQNFDPALSDVFFKELGVRAPNEHFGVRSSSFSGQTSQIIAKAGEAMRRLKPDAVLLLGDTNSALSSIVAARLGIPVFHMEAGNRCYDDRVPEEINRRIIDHSSRILMPYTHRSKENLIREGIQRERIFVVGNPIYEVLKKREEAIASRTILRKLKLSKQRYFLATLHRAENVDDQERLSRLMKGLSLVAGEFGYPVIVSVHPRTADKLQKVRFKAGREIMLMPPMGFLDFVKLETNALAVLTDSGTVQEECCIFSVPNVTLRDVTERAETIECGSNMLTGSSPALVLHAVKTALAVSSKWNAPPEYLEADVSSTVAKIVLGYHHGPF